MMMSVTTMEIFIELNLKAVNLHLEGHMINKTLHS